MNMNNKLKAEPVFFFSRNITTIHVLQQKMLESVALILFFCRFSTLKSVVHIAKVMRSLNVFSSACIYRLTSDVVRFLTNGSTSHKHILFCPQCSLIDLHIRRMAFVVFNQIWQSQCELFFKFN